MKIGYIGLGKMGRGQVLRLAEAGHEVVAWNRSKGVYSEIEKAGIKTAETLEELVGSLSAPRTLWIMVTASALDEILTKLSPLLATGDLIIDGGNSFYKDTLRRHRELREKGILFADVGVSGGPAGARDGACLMIGSEKEVFEKMQPVFKDLSYQGNCFEHVGKVGSGHFVKMVHNGIEYGMMQSIAEGFAILKKSDFELDLKKVAGIYNCRSVIESRLIGWLKDGFEKYGEDLNEVSGVVKHTGEGEWTVEAAKELGVPAPAISEALQFRKDSGKAPSYEGKILSALRNMFGGHGI